MFCTSQHSKHILCTFIIPLVNSHGTIQDVLTSFYALSLDICRIMRPRFTLRETNVWGKKPKKTKQTFFRYSDTHRRQHVVRVILFLRSWGCCFPKNVNMCVCYNWSNHSPEEWKKPTVIQDLPLVSRLSYYIIDHHSAPRQWTVPISKTLATNQLRS